MRLLTVTHFYASHGGGIERVAGKLCEQLAAMGHRCEWTASSSDTPPDDPGVTVVPLGCINPTEKLTGLPMPIPGPRGLIRLVRAVGRSDGVIVHDALYVTSIVALVTARVRRKPVVLVQHIAQLPFASRLLRTAMKLGTALVTRPMLRAATGVVFISSAVRQAFADVPLRKPARLLFNGIDSATFHTTPPPNEGRLFRDRHNLPADSPLIAFVGRHVPRKGLSILREVAARRPDFTFVLAGSGPIDPADWRLPNVRSVGNLPPGEVAAMLRTSQALLLPSEGEGYPLVVQEALACGLPVICGLDSAAADPDAARFLHGVKIDLTDPNGTALHIVPLLDALEPNADTRRAAAEYASGAYSWPEMARAIVDHLGLGTIRHPAFCAAA